MEEYKLSPHTKYGDLISLESFVEDCKDYSLINDDGVGYYATETHKSNLQIKPSDVVDNNYRKDFTYVMWYNK